MDKLAKNSSSNRIFFALRKMSRTFSETAAEWVRRRKLYDFLSEGWKVVLKNKTRSYYSE